LLRWQASQAEIDDLDTQITPVVTAAAPGCCPADPSTKQDNDPARTGATGVDIIMAATQSARRSSSATLAPLPP
jgi:hypothetical protein